MKKITALLLTACVHDGGSNDYEFPTGGAITTANSNETESSKNDNTTESTEESSTTTSEIPNVTDDDYSKRY